MIKHEHRYEQFTFRSYVNYFADPDPVDLDHGHDASGDGISDADTYWLSSDPLIDGRAAPPAERRVRRGGLGRWSSH